MLFERELHQATQGAERGTEVRLVALAGAQIAGFVNLSEIARGVFQNAYASWAVNAALAGRGYATEGVSALLDFAFTSEAQGGLGLHRVQANIIPANARSIRLAERVGFRREGLALRYLRIAGEWQDHALYATTAEERPGGGVFPPPPR